MRNRISNSNRLFKIVTLAAGALVGISGAAALGGGNGTFLGPSMSSTFASPDGAKSAAEVFAWYEKLPKAFEKRGLLPITSYWSPTYSETLIDTDGKKSSKNKAQALQFWMAQIRYSGANAASNGPGEVLISSVDETKDGLIVSGYWNGSWRQGEPGALTEQGMSFESTFRCTWKKVDGAWMLDKWVETIPKEEFPEAKYNEFKATHEALKKRFGVGK